MARNTEYKMQRVDFPQEYHEQIPGITVPQTNYTTSIGGSEAPEPGATDGATFGVNIDGGGTDLNQVDNDATISKISEAIVYSQQTAGEAIAANDALVIARIYKGGSLETDEFDADVYTDITDMARVATDTGDPSIANASYGSETQSYVGFVGNETSHIVLMLDKTLAGTVFKLNIYNLGTVSNLDIDVYENRSSWTEGAVTWNTKPTTGKKIGSFSATTASGYLEVTCSNLPADVVNNINSYGITLTPAAGTGPSDSTSFYTDDAASNKPGTNVATGGTVGTFILKAIAQNSIYGNNFIGFAAEAISEDATGLVYVNGVVGGFSGLTVGDTYYLSGTAGAISNSAGGTVRKVGIAVSDTQIMIKHDNV